MIRGSMGARANDVSVGWTAWSDVPVARCVCKGRGYSEEWTEREDLPKLVQAFG